MTPSNSPLPGIDAVLQDLLARFPTLEHALVFGSDAQGRAIAGSDLDIAVAADKPLTDFMSYRNPMLAERWAAWIGE